VKKNLIYSLVGCVSVSLLSGCGLIPGSGGGSENSTQIQEQQQTVINNTNVNTNNNSNESGGVAAKAQGEEITMRVAQSYPSFYEYPASSQPGVKIHTKEKHAGALTKYMQYSWDTEDLLEVQVDAGDLYGKNLVIMRVEKKGADLYNIVVRAEESGSLLKKDEKNPPRGFAFIEKGSINVAKAKFTVTTEDGKELPLQ
jgi:hypothetical protein